MVASGTPRMIKWTKMFTVCWQSRFFVRSAGLERVNRKVVRLATARWSPIDSAAERRLPMQEESFVYSSPTDANAAELRLQVLHCRLSFLKILGREVGRR
jgi:hypothetical protein